MVDTEAQIRPGEGGTADAVDANGSLASRLRRIREAAGGARVALHLRQDDVLITAATDPPILFGREARRTPLERGLAGRVAAAGEPLYVADLTEVPEARAPREPLGEDARSYLGVPLLHGADLLGVLQVDAPTGEAFPSRTRDRIVEAGAELARWIGGPDDPTPDDPAPDPESVAISTVAHELRAPVAALRGLSETLASGVARHNRDLVVEIAHRIARATERLDRLVADLYDLSRGGLAGLAIDLEAVALRPLLEALAEEAPEGSPVWLDLELDLPEVLADPLRLRQALENLLGNARRYSPSGSEIRLTARRSGDEVAIEVADRGAGIDPAIRDRIFEPFVRGEARPGLGLGLALVRRIADAMNARIEVDSEPGAGSTFRLLLRPAL